jgi:predicted dehydrogenase
MKNLFLLLFLSILMSCNTQTAEKKATKPVQLVTLDPGHFHAALVQKSMYDDVDETVHVYAPIGQDVKWHFGRIEGYNKRADNPTHWIEKEYINDDFFEKMIAEKKGNLVVISGNNRLKTDYIFKSLQNGFNVLADKPMVINSADFEKLKMAFDTAAKNNKLLYDIMTERFEVTTMLQRELSQTPSVFGTLEKGTPQNPAITKESIHHFYKFVSGSVLTRPQWFMDVKQQGEGIVDVMTHLVDLVQWECFPEQIIDYQKDIKINTAKRWSTDMSLSQFKTITKSEGFPEYLKSNIVKDSILQVYCNAEVNYALRGVHAKTSVIWNYQAPEGTGDTHYSIMRGTKANLVIRQGKAENYKTTLYIEPVGNSGLNTEGIKAVILELSKKYAGISVEVVGKNFKINIPDALKTNHEAHFAQVTAKFLEYLKKGNLPSWEVPNMIAKYYTTTQALNMASKK